MENGTPEQAADSSEEQHEDREQSAGQIPDLSVTDASEDDARSEDSRSISTKSCSRIPRPLLGKQSPDSLSQTSEQRSFKGLEARYKLQFKRYTQCAKDMATLSNRMLTTKKTLLALKEQMIDQLNKDPGDLPPYNFAVDPEESRLQVEAIANYTKKLSSLVTRVSELETENAKLIEKLENAQSYYDEKVAYVNKVSQDMPELEEHYRKVAEEVDRAEGRQTDLEQRLAGQALVLEDLTVAANRASIFKNRAELVQKELEETQAHGQQIRSEMHEKLEIAEEQMAVAKKEAAFHKTRCDSAEFALAQSQEEKNMLEEKLKRIMAKCEYLERENSKVNVSVGEELQNERKISTELEKKIEALQDELERSGGFIMSMEIQIEEMQEQLDSTEKNHITQQKKLLESLSRDTTVKDEKIMNLNTQLVQIQEELSRGIEEKRALEAAVFDARRERNISYQKELRALEEEMRKTVHEKEVQDGKVEELEEAVTKVNNEKQELVKINEAQGLEIRALQQRHQDHLVEIQRLLQVAQDTPKTRTEERRTGNPALWESAISEEIGSTSASLSSEEFGTNRPQSVTVICSRVSAARGIAPDYEELYTLLEEKKGALLRLEQKLNEVEKKHERCAKRKSMYEARIAKLETNLAFLPNHLLQM